MDGRRTWILKTGVCFGTFGAMGLLTGCANAPPRRLNASGQACFSLQRPRRLICSDAPAPSVEIERDIRRLGATSDALTVYVIRRRIGDTGDAVPMTINGNAGLIVPPFSMARLRLVPGSHRLWLNWHGEDSTLQLTGRAGDVQFVEMRRRSWTWSWHALYDWRMIESEDLARRLLDSRVIADMDLRRSPSS